MTIVAMGVAALLPAALFSQEAIPVSRPTNANHVKIGMNRMMFRDIPAPMLTMLATPFQKLLEAQTSLTGHVEMVRDANSLAKQIQEGQVQIGVFQGFEFAWLKSKYPELEPMMITVPMQKKLQAYLITRKESSIKEWSQLQGEKVAMPRGSKEHCRLFLEHGKNSCKSPIEFGEITTQESIEDALHDVFDGVVSAAVVDVGALVSFGNRFPVRYGRLKAMAYSDVFPATVIAYRKGMLDEVTINRIRTGLTTAHLTSQGKAMMTMWKMSNFDTVPGNYNEQLAKILESYPVPVDTISPK